MNSKRAIIIITAVLLAILGALFFINNRNDSPKSLIEQGTKPAEDIKTEETVDYNENAEASKTTVNKENKFDDENVSQSKKVTVVKKKTDKTVKKQSNAPKVKPVSIKKTVTDKKTSQNIGDVEDDSNVLKESVYKDNAIEIKQQFKPTKDYKVVFQDKVYLIRLRRPVIREVSQTTVEEKEENGIYVGE